MENVSKRLSRSPQLISLLLSFSSPSVLQLSDLLDWKKLGLEYAKARQLALRRAYPDSFEDEDEEGYFDDTGAKVPPPLSMPGSPKFGTGPLSAGMRTPGDFGTLSEDMQALSTSDYKGSQFWRALNNQEDEEEEAFRFREYHIERSHFELDGEQQSLIPFRLVPLTDSNLSLFEFIFLVTSQLSS